MIDAYLLIEENKFFADVVSEKISAKLDLPLLLVPNRQAALALIDQSDYHFVAAITSLILSDSPRGEVVDLLLEKAIPTLVLTSQANEEIRQQLSKKNIVDYLLKHEFVDATHLVSILNRLHTNPRVSILVVDDSRSTRNVLKNMLQAHRYKVIEAESGKQALEILNSEHIISLVLIDYEMPEMDGVQLLRQIRHKFDSNQLPVIGLSSMEEQDLVLQFLKAGANDFLFKPFSKEIFYFRIKQMLDVVEAMRVIRDASSRDFLTSLPNRKFFFEKAEPIYQRALTENYPLIIAALDIDYFKTVNDLFGHDAGDQVLVKVAQTIRDCLRPNDCVARFGGEEFMVLLDQVDQASGWNILERIRIAVEKTIIALEQDKINVTISIGAVTSVEFSIERTLSKADALLYEAKARGRNRIVFE